MRTNQMWKYKTGREVIWWYNKMKDIILTSLPKSRITNTDREEQLAHQISLIENRKTDMHEDLKVCRISRHQFQMKDWKDLQVVASWLLPRNILTTSKCTFMVIQEPHISCTKRRDSTRISQLQIEKLDQKRENWSNSNYKRRGR